MRIEDALRVAADADLDLVEVAPNARPPVCKIMDYGKYKYEAAQKARESRRNQQQTVVKEQKLRPKIDDHDYETKKGHVVRFLEAGSKVKVTIISVDVSSRGRSWAIDCCSGWVRTSPITDSSRRPPSRTDAT
ncbi:Translation initiation factor IF-3 [Mycobacterium tuberculosis]|nr:Translation initiation factor IF-3 [Mycobacterium tuberculosis]